MPKYEVTREWTATRWVTDSREIEAASPQTAEMKAQQELEDGEEGSCPHCGAKAEWEVKDDQETDHELVHVTAKLVEEDDEDANETPMRTLV